MMKSTARNYATLLGMTLMLVLFQMTCADSGAEVLTVQHDLKIELILVWKKLIAEDEMHIVQSGERTLTFSISPRAHIRTVTMNKTAAQYTLQSGKLSVLLISLSRAD